MLVVSGLGCCVWVPASEGTVRGAEVGDSTETELLFSDLWLVVTIWVTWLEMGAEMLPRSGEKAEDDMALVEVSEPPGVFEALAVVS